VQFCTTRERETRHALTTFEHFSRHLGVVFETYRLRMKSTRRKDTAVWLSVDVVVIVGC